jgi:hypothetical protein
MKPKLSLFVRPEKTKPSDKKAGIAGFMLGWEWEKVGSAIEKWFARRKK